MVAMRLHAFSSQESGCPVAMRLHAFCSQGSGIKVH